MHVRMLCLGRHWNGKTCQLRADRGPTSTASQRRRMPGEFKRARRDALAASVGMTLDR